MVKLLVVVDVKDMVVVLVNVVGRKVVNSSAGSALLLSDTKGSPGSEPRSLGSAAVRYAKRIRQECRASILLCLVETWKE